MCVHAHSAPSANSGAPSWGRWEYPWVCPGSCQQHFGPCSVPVPPGSGTTPVPVSPGSSTTPVLNPPVSSTPVPVSTSPDLCPPHLYLCPSHLYLCPSHFYPCPPLLCLCPSHLYPCPSCPDLCPSSLCPSATPTCPKQGVLGAPSAPPQLLPAALWALFCPSATWFCHCTCPCVTCSITTPVPVSPGSTSTPVPLPPPCPYLCPAHLSLCHLFHYHTCPCVTWFQHHTCPCVTCSITTPVPVSHVPLPHLSLCPPCPYLCPPHLYLCPGPHLCPPAQTCVQHSTSSTRSELGILRTSQFPVTVAP
ncbi:uncharacterized protein LOC143696441 [Agelaius phoeniceus]|uniref:uncharacterized protein LOC143696441 n=1 Tax=Agelaius phoeniceus TaxID=39638 RepID=UPI004054A733